MNKKHLTICLAVLLSAWGCRSTCEDRYIQECMDEIRMDDAARGDIITGDVILVYKSTDLVSFEKIGSQGVFTIEKRYSHYKSRDGVKTYIGEDVITGKYELPLFCKSQKTPQHEIDKPISKSTTHKPTNNGTFDAKTEK